MDAELMELYQQERSATPFLASHSVYVKRLFELMAFMENHPFTEVLPYFLFLYFLMLFTIDLILILTFYTPMDG